MMTPEREFLLTVFSCYLDHYPSEAKQQAIDMCAKYLAQHKKATKLEAQTKLLEEKIDELTIDYRILRIELEREQQKNLSNSINISERQSVELPEFLSKRKFINHANIF